jgi:hypothetical protein
MNPHGHVVVERDEYIFILCIIVLYLNIRYNIWRVVPDCCMARGGFEVMILNDKRYIPESRQSKFRLRWPQPTILLVVVGNENKGFPCSDLRAT